MSSLAFGHPAGAERQRDRDNCRQTLGDGGDGQADRGEHHVLGRLTSGHARAEDDRADDDRRGGQSAAEHRQVPLQRRGLGM